ncbi:MAG: T9SS type A sorting domain-containing protein [Saprospiraceae bacterium]|nr:T9SS type A sorting domain-containing protein [Saprospiraceae bacterium]
MKKLLTHFTCLTSFALALFFATQVTAQGTHNSGIDSIRIRIKTGTSSFIDVRAGNCGYGTTAPASTTDPTLIDWSGTLGNSFCAPIAWAYGTNQDTFGCAALPAGSLTGKIALIRRGGVPAACGFSAKALNAQNAGAVAVIIANHHLNAADNDCTVNGMQNGPEGSSITIPVYFVCRAVADQIDAAIRAGGAEVCLLRPDVEIDGIYLPTASKRTPVSQIPVDTLGFALTLTNRAATNLTTMEMKAEVFDVSNNLLHSTSKMYPDYDPAVADSFEIISFGEFAPELPVGDYRVRYSTTASNGYGIPDVAETRFYVSSNLFSKDDGATIAYRPNPTVDYGVGAMYTMNPKITEKYMTKTIQFAFATNAGELPAASVSADIYLFKIKDDITANLNNFVRDGGFISPSFDWLGTAPYVAQPGTTSFSDQSAELIDISTGNFGVELEAGKRYVAAVQYSGIHKAAFHAFDEDAEIGYPSLFIHWPNASGAQTWFNGFSDLPGLNPVVRMFLDLVNTTDETKLPEASMQIRPNPIVETLNLQVELDQATDVTVTIADLTGRVITYEVREGFTNGLLTYQLPQLASGTYLARIATKQGTLTKKFIVQK